jgi:lipid II:glycine glycyltransferase (peptidoglycan interpeptide bridge formation enzyme)
MVGDGRARLVLSCAGSTSDEAGYRQRLGRANRLLHWQDMQQFSEQGLRCYDFGGV